MSPFWIFDFIFWIGRSNARIISFTLAGLLFVLCTSVVAQQQSKVPKIGFLSRQVSDAAGRSPRLERELRALGYVEGKVLDFAYRRFDSKLDRLPALADELVRLNVEVLFTPGINEAVAAKNATRTIPIVFSTTADPVAAGLVESLAQPGGNITGFTYFGTELSGKRLELLKETVPNLSRVATFWTLSSTDLSRQETEDAARLLNVQLIPVEIRISTVYKTHLDRLRRSV